MNLGEVLGERKVHSGYVRTECIFLNIDSIIKKMSDAIGSIIRL